MNKHFPRPRKSPTPTQTNGALEDHQLLKAQRAFHTNLMENFPKYLAEFDAKLNAINAERLTLIEKHERAPGKVVECDRMIASLERTYGLTPKPL